MKTEKIAYAVIHRKDGILLYTINEKKNDTEDYFYRHIHESYRSECKIVPIKVEAVLSDWDKL